MDRTQEGGEASGRGLTHHALGGVMWLVSSSGVQSVIRVFVFALLARLLSPEDFGLVAAAATVIGLADLFSQLGVGPALVQLPDLTERHVKTAFSFSVLFGCLIGGLIWGISPFIASFFQMEQEGLTSVLQVLSLVFPLHAISMVARNLLTRELKYKRLAGVDVLAYSVGFGVVGTALAWLDFGVWALVWGRLAQAAVEGVILFTLQPHSVRPYVHGRSLKELVHYGGGFTLSRVFNFFALQGDYMVVGRWLGPAALGFYNRAYLLMNMSDKILGNVLNVVLFPAFAKVQGDPQRLAHAYRRGAALSALLFLPISVAAVILAPELIAVILGPGWEAAIVPFQILAAGMVLRMGYKMSGIVVRGTGHIYDNAWRQAVYALCVVGGAWIGQHWGIVGVACSTLASLGVIYLLLAQLCLRITHLSWGELLVAQLQSIVPGALVGALTWSVTFVLRSLNWPALLVLVVTVAVVLVGAAALAYVLPKAMLGRYGIWLVDRLADFVPGHRHRLLRQAKQGMKRMAA